MSKRLKLLIMITFLALFAIIIFKAFDEKANGDLSGLEILEPLESRKTIVVGMILITRHIVMWMKVEDHRALI